jgi:Spy/CpxP family protein refolding chaperone
MSGKKWVWMIAAAVVLLATGVAAQPLGVPPGRWWERPQVADELALTAEQKARLETLTVENARGMIDLKAGVEKAELDLRAAAEAEPFDAAKVRAAFREVQQARTRLENERFESLLRVREVLNAEQWRRLRELTRAAVRERVQERRGGQGGPPARPPRDRQF